jgi:hypothetical protein
VTYLTAADATVTGRTYTAIPFLGSDTGTFTRTMADSTRFKVSGAGGVVTLAVGDASPDNVGGTGKLQGWNSTQADLWTLDAATINTTGRYTEIGKKIPGTVYTPGTTFAAAATVDIPLTADPTGVRAWEVFVYDLIGSAPIGVYFRFSYDGGVTYKSASGDYQSAHDYHVNTTPTSISNSSAQTSIILPVAFASTANRPQLISLNIITPSSGPDATVLLGNAIYYDGGAGIPQRASIGGFGIGGYGKATHVRIGFNSGTGTGAYRVVPLRGFGES